MARHAWTSRLASLGSGGELIGGLNYFIDRIAFGLFAGDPDPISDLPPFCYPSTDYHRNLAGWLRADGLVHPNLYPPSISSQWHPSAFFCDLVMAWDDHLTSLGITTSSRFDPHPFGTLTDFFSCSVYYPGPPAIPGPLYLGRLGNRQATILKAFLGEARLVDFALALSLIHEGSHFLQTGDPLLAEFAWAKLWMSFLDRYGLWALQRNFWTGEVCNLEAPYWANITLTDEQTRSFFLDTYVGICATYPDGPSRYQACCSLSHMVYTGSLSYDAYLGRLAATLRNN